MSDERTASVEVDIRRAVDELTGLIESRYPSASFGVRPGVDDPDATYIAAMVDIDDPDEVMDLVVDRLLELQLAAGLLVYVLPIHPPARAARTRWRHEQAPAAAPSHCVSSGGCRSERRTSNVSYGRRSRLP